MADLTAHAALGITSELLVQAQVRRVDDLEARERLTTKHPGNLAGILYPYLQPNNGHATTYRLRRDHPEIEHGKPKDKYLSAWGDAKRLYFPPGCAALLTDITVTVLLAEAEKSVLSIMCASQTVGRSVLAVGTSGCWGWRGRIGKTEDANGARVDEMGPLPDLDFITWNDRQVVIAFDANSATNESVQIARRGLAKVLTGRGALVRIVDLPTEPGVNGPDDYIGRHGAEMFFALVNKAGTLETAGRHVTLQSASELVMRRAIYLFDQRVPVGMLSLLAGREGLGKSLLSQTIAADLTQGRLAGCYRGKPKSVIIVATEDAWEYVIVPRLKVAGADASRCFRVNITTTKYGSVELSLPDDLPALTPLVKQHDVALLLLDPIISRLGSKLDTHVDAEVRQALEPLRGFAEALRLAVLGIIHPNKSQSGIPTDPLNMIMGSRAFSAVSRSTLFLQADPEDARLYLLHIKNNVGPQAPTLEFSITDALAGFDDAREEVHAPRVDWRGEHDPQERWQNLLQELRSKEQKAKAPDSARVSAAEFLSRYLAKGPAESSVVIAAASKAGIIKRTLQRAADDLKITKSWTQDHPPKMLWALMEDPF
jgi:hypothetical protein